MTELQFAKHRSVSRTTVQSWKAKGLLVMDGGQIHQQASDAVLDARPRYYRGGKTSRRVTQPAETPPDVAAPVEERDFTDAANWTTAEATRR